MSPSASGRPAGVPVMKDKPQEILSRLVAGGASGRKLRLFACACWRRVRREGLWARLHRAVETAERYADGLAGRKDLLDAKSAAWDLATRLARLVPSLSRLQPRDVLLAAYATEETTSVLAGRLLDAVAWQEVAAVAPDLLLDVFGPLPVRRTRIDPAWLAWNGGAVVKLAGAVYEQREAASGALDGARLGVLADALEEAGCDDADLLGHLRAAGPHVRGCHAVDLLLAKALSKN